MSAHNKRVQNNQQQLDPQYFHREEMDRLPPSVAAMAESTNASGSKLLQMVRVLGFVQEVFELDVPMYNVMRVDIVHRQQHPWR